MYIEKYCTYLTVCFYAFLGLANSSSFTVAITPVAAQLHTTTNSSGVLDINSSAVHGPGLSLLGAGYANRWKMSCVSRFNAPTGRDEYMGVLRKLI